MIPTNSTQDEILLTNHHVLEKLSINLSCIYLTEQNQGSFSTNSFKNIWHGLTLTSVCLCVCTNI